MRFEKKRLACEEHGYSIGALRLSGSDRIVAAPEGNGPVVVFSPDGKESTVLAREPGGCMGFAPFPGRDDALFMITRFYPIFKAENAGIDLLGSTDGLEAPWVNRRILDLPFVHRISCVTNGAESFLIGATVCGGKDFQDDWSRPGSVYAAEISGSPDGQWRTETILEGVHRNHGMNTGVYNGGECVFVSGDEGIFAIGVPSPGSREWSIEKIFDTAVSELYFADLDGDGEYELAVIERFHGDAMSVFKKKGETWQKIFSAPLSFGHGLWAGELAGGQAVIVGNRAGQQNLVCYRAVQGETFTMEEYIVDEGSGTTNLDVIKGPEGEAVVASNAGHGEYAMYQVEA